MSCASCEYVSMYVLAGQTGCVCSVDPERLDFRLQAGL